MTNETGDENMTSTIAPTDVQVPTTEPDAASFDSYTVRFPATDLARIFHNASLFVSKENHRPTLQCVHVRFIPAVPASHRADGTPINASMIVESTDSYALYQDRIDVPAPIATDLSVPSRSYLLMASDLAPIVKALRAIRPVKYGEPEQVKLTLCRAQDSAPSAARVTFALGSASFDLTTYDGDFPNIDQLFSDADPNLPSGSIILRPDQLARLAKMLDSSGKTYATNLMGLTVRVQYRPQARYRDRRRPRTRYLARPGHAGPSCLTLPPHLTTPHNRWHLTTAVRYL